jgi:ferrous iron transport protein A
MSDATPLSNVKAGQTATIQSLRGGYGFRSRLASLGFTPEAQVTMLQNQGRGPLLVALRGTRIALGRGEAQKIFVETSG